ncbi:hypothetical protein CROQUDRAFT_129647 [Cronartium quercuum f. sp. fusiforme G11]|uniref:Uncharacterized protein n=1 Tax=Cronartium quercuum f. sp. fusiforme G11 TaxID=708437 RepID=A0A9P6NU05_9BASI|nr:hypothetical protein CROQUDRAFT_129647 [Cronartium quercuum f. sp. fusiforme G11]
MTEKMGDIPAWYCRAIKSFGETSTKGEVGSTKGEVGSTKVEQKYELAGWFQDTYYGLISISKTKTNSAEDVPMIHAQLLAGMAGKTCWGMSFGLSPTSLLRSSGSRRLMGTVGCWGQTGRLEGLELSRASIEVCNRRYKYVLNLSLTKRFRRCSLLNMSPYQ